MRFMMGFVAALLLQASLFVCAAHAQDKNTQEVGALYRYVVQNGTGQFVGNIPAYTMDVDVLSQSPCETASVTLTATVTSPEFSVLELSFYANIPNEEQRGWIMPGKLDVVLVPRFGEIIGAQAQDGRLPIPVSEATAKTLTDACVSRLIKALCILVR